MFPNEGLNEGWRVKFIHERKLNMKVISIICFLGLVLIEGKNVNGLDAVCVSGMSKYASSKGPGFYYECNPGDDIAVLKECPEGAIWDKNSMLCDEKPVLGRSKREVKKVNGLDAVCVPGVSKYASSKGPGFYYECKKGDDLAVLKECPKGAIWDRKSMLCGKKPLTVRKGKEMHKATDEKDDTEILFVPVLGRTVSLGDLYDARRDLPLNGFSLWNEKVVEEKKLIKSKPYSNTHFFFEKSQNDRFALFSVDASLKLGFLGGMITVEGSAHYLKDSKETSNHIRFNMMYEATTRTETLPMSLRQNLTYPDICGKFMKNSESGPTHVISSVEYGIKAVFMFEKFVSTSESKEEIGGHLKVVVKSIPSFTIEGEAEIHVNGAEKNVRDSMDVKMFGDFIVEHSPTTFLEAVAVYRDLPTYLGDKASNYKDSSPVKIMLTPLGKYCTEAHLVMTGISAELMTKTTEIMLDLGKVMLSVRTLESTYLANKFLDVSALLKLFRIELDVYTIEIKTQLRDIIPAMRGGGGEEQLPILLKNYMDSPFQYDYGLRFLQEREAELNTINSLFDDSLIANGDITIGDFTSANVAHALIHKTYVFIYKFNVFSNINITKDYLKDRDIVTDTWYNNYKLIGLAGYNWREFKSFVNINKESSQDQDFFIQGSPLGNKLTQIFVYENGIELTSDFKVPMPPTKPKVVAKTYNSITLLLGNTHDIIKNEFITEILVQYGTDLDLESDYHTVIINAKEYQLWKKGKNKRCYKPCGSKGGPCETICGKGGYCCRKGFHDCPDGAQKLASGSYSCIVNAADSTGKIMTTIEIPQDAHSFKTTFQTSFGRGRESEALTGVRPLASSPPKLEPVEHIDSTSVKLKWKKPDVISGHLSLSGYKVDITNVSVFNTSDQEMTITNLEPATKYTIYLEAWFSDWMIVGETTQFDIYTIPTQPEKPSAIKIGKHDVALQLDLRDELVIAPDAIFKLYKVIFYKVDINMTQLLGTQYERDFKNSKIEISSLTQGTKYNFEYRIVTSKGSSLFSPPLFIETHYNKTELDEINEEIENRSDEMMKHINTEMDEINEEMEKRSAEMMKHINTEISQLKLAPLGTIIAWVKNPSYKSGKLATIPSGWQKCDGSIIPQPSIWAGLRTPNLNGEKRFLRGGNDQDMLNMEEDTTKIPDHTHRDNGHTHTATSKADPHSHPFSDQYTYITDHGNHGNQFNNGRELGYVYKQKSGQTSGATVTVRTTIQQSTCGMGGVNNLGNFAKETRPKNMNVIYIMRIL